MRKSVTGSWLLAGVFVLSAALSGCAGSGEKSGACVDDSWITSKVKSEMIADKNVPARDINVQTTRGVVTLSGKVDNWNASNRAAEIAHGVKGMTQFENDIRVN
jgi:hyperosmotically inducible periplasmic protein